MTNRGGRLGVANKGCAGEGEINCVWVRARLNLGCINSRSTNAECHVQENWQCLQDFGSAELETSALGIEWFSCAFAGASWQEERGTGSLNSSACIKLASNCAQCSHCPAIACSGSHRQRAITIRCKCLRTIIKKSFARFCDYKQAHQESGNPDDYRHGIVRLTRLAPDASVVMILCVHPFR